MEVVVVVFVMIMVSAVVVNQQSKTSFQAKRTEFGTFADEHGLELEMSRPAQHGERGVAPPPRTGLWVLERGGSERSATHYMQRPDSPAVVFEYRASMPSSGGDSSNYRTQRNVIALVALTAPAPSFLISSKKPMHRNDHPKPEKLATGDAVFDQSYWLTSEDPAATLSIVDASAASNLHQELQRWPEIEMEVGHGYLACTGPHEMPPAERMDLLDTAQRVAEILFE